jgi:hypothetical protein
LKVTGWPNVDGFKLDASVTVGGALLTVCVIVALSLLKLPSPLYTALIEWIADVSEPVLTWALSPVRATVPMELAPS